ncbi:multicopper oxidase CueO [Vibrio hibernica]|uniref:multicopper oxidase CueO n=1 Tax=Vibrio hibernica TaxID=2587465 RepID=UPI00187FC556|nr:multicopper oxidase CueO [Vibrio hibernica]
MERREFIKKSAIASVALTTINTPYAWATSSKNSNSGTLKNQPSLPIPPLLDTNSEHITQLTVQSGFSQFMGNTQTKTSGINGAFLGPALKVRSGDIANLQVNNQLDETITLHWHGLDIAGQYDGGPHQKIKANERWNIQLPVNQPAATCWFHPHQVPQTAELVMQGIAGLIVIEDEVSDQLNLPSTWGVDDIPVIIQDRKFDAQGQFDYELLDIVNVAMGFAGDTLLINGAIHPKIDVPQGWVRLRFLNGSNARSYQLATSDQREFYVIASDSGFLEKPVPLKQLHLVAGERYEILVNIEGDKPFDLVTLPLHQMGMMMPPFNQTVPFLTLNPQKTQGKGELPKKMVEIERYQAQDAKVKREIVLEMGENLDSQAMMLMMKRKSALTQRMAMAHGHHMNDKNVTLLTKDELKDINRINGQPFDMQRIDLDVKQGQLEHWVISQGNDMMLHPFHIHGCRFQVLSMNGERPAPHLSGWKDTIAVLPKGKTEILVQFNHLADKHYPYMAHCHILEHEDTGMMMQFTVS